MADEASDQGSSDRGFREEIREKKTGGAIVFAAIFLGPFVGAGAVALSRSFVGVPVWAPLLGLVAVHWMITAIVTRMKTNSPRPGVAMLVWCVGAALADVMWFGVLLTLAAAVAGVE